MKLIILGQGHVGRVLGKILLKEKNIQSILFCDIKENEQFKSKKVSFKKLNLSKQKDLLNLLREQKADLVVNAAHFSFNKKIMDACYKTKTNYLDLASDMWAPERKIPYKIDQWDFKKRFEKENLLALINAGVSPGLTNLFAGQCAAFFDKIDEMTISLVEDSRSKDPYFSWSVNATLDEAISEPLIFKNKKHKLLPILTKPTQFIFPKPFGKKWVKPLPQDEAMTIPKNIKMKHFTIQDFDSQRELLDTLFLLGFLSEEEITLEKSKVIPLKFCEQIISKYQEKRAKEKKNPFPEAQFAFLVDCIGKKKGQKKKLRYFITFPKEQEIKKLKLKANFITYPTALATSLFIQHFFEIEQKGVLATEQLNEQLGKKIINELKRKGVSVRRTVRSC